MALAHVMHGDIFDTSFGQCCRNSFGHQFGVSVHASVNERHPFDAFVTTETVVNLNDATALFRPDGAMRRTDHLNIDSRKFLQRFLHRAAVFTNDVRVVAYHFTPITIRIHLRIKHSSVESAERTESIGRE